MPDEVLNGFEREGGNRGVDTHVLYTCVHEQNKILYIKLFLLFAGLFYLLFVCVWGGGSIKGCLPT